ncbi:16S rRNA (guanine(966)-N(2))-methyltransferase RsmD, partial [Flavobacterium psychrophilum]|nr:16S rRNA (guanine(966)-N(2))-methyltransferase RsmD [Flavobacterium psychrophilum]
EQKDFEKIITLVFKNQLLEDDGMMVIEHSKYTKLNHMENFSCDKGYGGSVFTFFELAHDEEVSGKTTKILQKTTLMENEI